MLSISPVTSDEDYDAAFHLCRLLGEWDAVEAPAHGLDPELLLKLFHSNTKSDLRARFGVPGAMMLMARWEGAPAGCLAFEPFDDDTVELQKFFVDAGFRGKGIGAALLREIVAAISAGRRRRVVIHTTVYMKSAIAVYEAFQFARCPPFRPVPEDIQHTEVFLTGTV